MVSLPKDPGPATTGNRDLEIFLKRLGLGLILGLITLLVFRWVQQLSPNSLNTVVAWVSGLLAIELEVPLAILSVFGADNKMLAQLLHIYPLPAGFIAGFYCGAFRESIWKFFFAHVIAPPDREILIPIPDPRPYDPLWGSILDYAVDEHGKPLGNKEVGLPWIPPTHGKWLEAWNQLLDLVDRPSSDCRLAVLKRGPHGWFFPCSKDFKPFLWTMITGRSGSGKTRMGVEFLRHLACLIRSSLSSYSLLARETVLARRLFLIALTRSLSVIG